MLSCHLVIGGMSSGKSSWSLNYVSRYIQKCHQKCSVIVTADNKDKHFAEKISKHKDERLKTEIAHGVKLNVVEAPIHLADELLSANENEVCLVDSLDLWINNIIYKHKDKSIDWIWHNYCSKLLSVVEQRNNPIILVSTEVGQGVIPIHNRAIHFIEILGNLHQKIAKKADKVFYILAGRPICLADEFDFDLLKSSAKNTINVE